MPADPRLVWLACVLAAIVVVLSVVRSPAMPIPSCQEIKQHAKNYTRSQLIAMARKHKLTPEQWAAVKACLGETK